MDNNRTDNVETENTRFDRYEFSESRCSHMISDLTTQIEVPEMQGKAEAACWPRKVRPQFANRSALRALEGELRCMSRLICNHWDVGGCLTFAVCCSQAGRRWGHRHHRPRPFPSHLEAPGGWPVAGCDERVSKFLRRYQDEGLVPYTGWVLWMDDDGKRQIWEHTWCVDKDGELIDPSTAICGVPKGWAYIGLPEAVWDKIDRGEKLSIPIPGRPFVYLTVQRQST